MRSALPWLAASLLFTATSPALAYQFDYGTPDIPSPLNIKRGQMYMRMSHRYNAMAFPSDSAPSLNLGLGLTKQLALDFVTSTHNRPIDAELSFRYQLLDEYDGTPFALTTRLGYTSHLGGSGIGELVASRNNVLPGLGIGLIGRYFSYVGDYAVNPGWMTATGIGLSYSVAEGINLLADVVAPLDRSVIDNRGFNWSTGLQWWIPDTPHVLMVMVGRMGPGTTHGRTFSPGRDTLRAGFEYHAHFDFPWFPGQRTITIKEDEE